MDLARRMAALSPEQRIILEEKLLKSNIGILQLPIPSINRDQEHYPLSFGQERLWFIDQLEPGNPAYNLVRVSKLEGGLNRTALELSLNAIVSRYEILRASFVIENGKPVQIIRTDVHIPLNVIDLKSRDAVEQDKEIKRLVSDESLFPFDLSKGPLLRTHLLELSPGVCLFILIIHHIITDGSSIQLFIRELVRYYDFFSRDPASTAPDMLPQALQYIDYVCWQRQWLSTGEGGGLLMKKQEAFWLEQFKGEIPVLDLPTDFPRPTLQSFAGGALEFIIGAEETAGLKGIVIRENVTMYILMLSIFNIFLSRISTMEDVVVGTPIACRRHPKLQDMMGMFVNTLALRNYPAGDKSFGVFLSEVKYRTLNAFENQEYRYEDIVARVSVNRDTSRNPLFDVMFLLKNLDYAVVKLPGLTLTPLDYDKKTSMFDLSCSVYEAGETLLLGFDYSAALFSEATARRLMSYFKTIIREISGMKSLDVSIAAIEYLPPKEKETVLFHFNDTTADFPDDTTIVRLFLRQAEKTPQAVAVISGDVRMTYRELDEQSGKVAAGLALKGVRRGEIVAVSMNRRPELMVALFGVLKAGCAYLPIDPQNPRERFSYLMNDASARLLINSENFTEFLSPLCQDGTEASPAPGDPAYVIYTSGSTGNPKGVLIEHRPVVNRLNWMQRAYPLTSGDVVLQKTTVTFDVSVWELFWWSLVGASVCLLEPEGEKSPESMIKTIREHAVTTMHFVPSMLNVFLEYVENSGGAAALTPLRTVFASGEALMPHHVDRFNRLLLDTNNTRLINLYGPTEATVDVSFFDCRAAEISRSIPIGKPIDNTRLYILDKSGRPQGVGIPGELCIAGVQLARGYLNRPELTAEKFVKIPHLGNNGEGGVTVYKTGDLARWLPDGNIEFLGRLDFQVKIRGFRIELGEIENLLVKMPDIKDAVVIARKDMKRNDYLCAYYTPRRNGDEPQVATIRAFLARQFPDYMIPSYFVPLQELPLTLSNKVNRKALPEPDGARSQSNNVYLAPQSEIEIIIAEQWKKVLNVNRVGIHDNFFELGGNSLNIIQLNTELKKALNREIPVVSLYRHLTISAFAAHLVEQDGGQSRQEALKRQQQREEQLRNAKTLFKQAVNKTMRGKNVR